jgi:single-strand DNA-binding protein
MKLGVNLKIDVSKIDKNKLFKGAKGTYLDAQVFIDIDPDQYGNNGMITQAVTKEEKQAGQRGAILGNAKIFWNDSQPQQQQQGGGWGQPQQPQQQQRQQQQQQYQQAQPQYNESHIDFDDEIPFAPIALQYRNILNAM